MTFTQYSVYISTFNGYEKTIIFCNTRELVNMKFRGKQLSQLSGWHLRICQLRLRMLFRDIKVRLLPYVPVNFAIIWMSYEDINYHIAVAVKLYSAHVVSLTVTTTTTQQLQQLQQQVRRFDDGCYERNRKGFNERIFALLNLTSVGQCRSHYARRLFIRRTMASRCWIIIL